MQHFKIRTKNGEHSEAIQKALFARGIYWRFDGNDVYEAKFTYCPFLIVRDSITFLEDESYYHNTLAELPEALFIDGNFLIPAFESSKQTFKVEVRGKPIGPDAIRDAILSKHPEFAINVTKN